MEKNIEQFEIQDSPMGHGISEVETPELPEITGEECLEMVGLARLADKKFRLADGRIIKGRDFLSVCPHEGVKMAFLGFSTLGASNPEYEVNKEALQLAVFGFINDYNSCD